MEMLRFKLELIVLVLILCGWRPKEGLKGAYTVMWCENQWPASTFCESNDQNAGLCGLASLVCFLYDLNIA